MNDATSLTGQRLISGQIARHIIRAAVVALIAFAFLAESGLAKPYSIGNASQNGFVNACQANGGTTKRLSTRVVECTLPNGYVIVCNFNSGLCIDYPPQAIMVGGDSTSTGSRAPIAPSFQDIMPASMLVQPVGPAATAPTRA